MAAVDKSGKIYSVLWNGVPEDMFHGYYFVKLTGEVEIEE